MAASGDLKVFNDTAKWITSAAPECAKFHRSSAIVSSCHRGFVGILWVFLVSKAFSSENFETFLCEYFVGLTVFLVGASRVENFRHGYFMVQFFSMVFVTFQRFQFVFLLISWFKDFHMLVTWERLIADMHKSISNLVLYSKSISTSSIYFRKVLHLLN